MNQKQLVRAVVRQVHPDLFSAHPYERSCNTESLKLLNNYAEALSQGQQPPPARLQFYVKDTTSGSLARVDAELPTRGSLVPLFLAFGLVTPAEAALDEEGWTDQSAGRHDLFEWLSQTAAEATRAADQHEALKRVVRELKSDIEDRFAVASVDMGGEYAVAAEEQQRQVEALRILQSGLESLDRSISAEFEGLKIRLHHPDTAPLNTVAYQDVDGIFNIKTVPVGTHVAENGTLHVLADSTTIVQQLSELDLERAHLMSRVTSYWNRRARDLSVTLSQFLGIERVYYDSRGEDNAQRFVLWSGTLLEMSEVASSLLMGRTFSFSLMVHCDPSGPLLDFIPSSSVLQVRCDCPPKHLLGFMTSQAGALAHQVAAQVADSKQEEEELLAEVRAALGAKHVIRVASSYDADKVVDAARRLIEAAPSLKAAVDLSGVSLAIDDCYELWESGFVSIPYDFKVSDLKPKLTALLSSPDFSSHPHNVEAAVGRNGSAISCLPVPFNAQSIVGRRLVSAPVRRQQFYRQNRISTLPLLKRNVVNKLVV